MSAVRYVRATADVDNGPLGALLNCANEVKDGRLMSHGSTGDGGEARPGRRTNYEGRTRSHDELEIEDDRPMSQGSTGGRGEAGSGCSGNDEDRTRFHDGTLGHMVRGMQLAFPRPRSPITESDPYDIQQMHSEARRGSETREHARGTIATSALDRLQSPESKSRKSLLWIVIAVLVSVLEVVFSVMNAAQEDAFNLTRFEDYIYAASSIMEVVGFVFGLACCFGFADCCVDVGVDGGIKHLGLPLTLMSTGVVEDDDTSRLIGFRGTVVQAAGIFVLLVVWLCLIIDWSFRIVVVIVVAFVPSSYCLVCRWCWRLCRRMVATAGPDGSDVVLPLSLTSGEREIPRWSYLTLPFSPVIIELLESYFLLRDFSLDRLVLLAIDILVLLPGIAWLVVQVFLCFKRRD